METLFEHKLTQQPKVSLVLLDWSVRESLHILDYLEHQDVPRESFEIIWIEYYTRRLQELQIRLNKCVAFGKHPALDKWIVMDMPADVYYHKHLMYNLGILVSSGQIVTVCDSDAFVRPTFIRSIIEAFEKDSNIVLHMDQFRNMNENFYPFNYPSFEEVITLKCMNNVGGKTRGIVDLSDPLHLRNYGACMCAMREDLIAVGGADEHMDYLGHICGPYDMTFRLVNAGKKEIWHTDEWLYHTRHPGQAGEGNYLGPHDGMHMSTTALEVIKTGRTLPLVENPAIRKLRLNGFEIQYSPLLSQMIPTLEIDKWNFDKAEWSSKHYWIGDVKIAVKERKVNKTEKLLQLKREHIKFSPRYILISVIQWWVIFWLTLRQLYFKVRNSLGNKTRKRSFLSDCRLAFVFLWKTWKSNFYTIRACEQVMGQLVADGNKEVAVYCTGHVARILDILSREMHFRISDIYDKVMVGEKFLNHKILPLEALKEYKGRIVIASVVGIVEKEIELEELGIDRKNIVRLL